MRINCGIFLAAAMLAASAHAAKGNAAPRDSLSLDGKWEAAKKEWGASNVVWRTFKSTVPADWRGRRVRVEIPGPLHKCDAVVWVNGKRAGDILRPGFEGVEATQLVRFGGENEIRFCLTESGEETARGATKAVTQLHRAKKGPAGESPRLAAYPAAFISDVFANTSWRKKRCDFEVEVDGGENLAQRRRDVELSIKVFDSLSNLVWSGEKKMAISKGINKAVVVMPWDEKIVAWELGRPALYTAQVSLCDSASLRDEKSVRFGFREVWRDGKEIMMNGHKAHFRPVYGFGTRTAAGISFLQGIGYNVSFRGHSREAVGVYSALIYNMHDECGMGMYANVGAYDILGADQLNKDPAMREEFRRFVRTFHRQVRNHPSLVAGILGTMSKTNQGFGPATIGRPRESASDRGSQIELACEIHREANPEIIYFSHADGPYADMDNGNVYLNWTPIHEQESWLEKWSEDGVYPWSSIEFLSPYPGDFVKQGVFLGTEFLASLYGDRAFREETDDFLARMGEADAAAKGHGSPVGNEMLWGMPLYWDLRRDWTWRLNSRWRAFGLNGGNMWFNLSEGFGDPPGWTGRGLARYSAVTNRVVGRPEWANEGYDIHRLGNLDFCGFIGGSPDFADRTHAYWAGEKIEKSLVFLWDGVGEKKVTAKWEISCKESKDFASYASFAAKIIRQGERVIVPISFAAPKVSDKTSFTMTATFTGEGIENFTDTYNFEVWPKEEECKVESEKCKVVELIDPSGEGGKVLDALGVKYRKIASVAEVSGDATRLVVGRDALEKISLDSLAPRVAEGLRIFIMRQSPEIWQRMGFRVQDLMVREVFARDQAFADLPQDALREWRGTPDYPNAPFGRVMRHAIQRGPRGTRRHTVAGLMLQTPERSGYLPLIVGGFDLNYSALLRFAPAEGGDITYCTLDFENRVGVDPAATETAKVVFGEFFGLFRNSTRSTCSTRLNNPVNPVNPVSKDPRVSASLRENYSLITCDEARAKTEGFSIGDETTIFRAEIPKCAAFRGVGPGDVRWPTGIKIRPLRGKGASPDGAFAVKRLADGTTLVFSQIPEGQLAARAASRDPKTDLRTANAERLDEGRVRRLYARLRTNCGKWGMGNGERIPRAKRVAEGDALAGVGTGNGERSLRRALHQAGSASFEPLPALHLLGPFSAGKDSGKLMLDTVWSEKGEAMAIAGDFDPNHEFRLPQGGIANWRPMLAPTADGVYDFTSAQPVASFPVTYAQCVVERKAAGEAILKLGCDWRVKVWCNGEEVFRSESGARIPRFEVKLNLKAGENVLAFKVGSGSSGHKLIALLATEKSGEDSAADPELDAMTLYEDDVVGFDPYEFHYW